MAAPNGMQPGGGAPYGLGSAIMPSAGHHQDMAHVWGLVEQLSGILHENRERWEELQSGIARAQIRPGNGDLGNGDVEGHAPEETAAEMQTRLVEAERKIEALSNAYKDQAQLVTEYENGLHEMVKLLRDRYNERSHEINSIHTYYHQLLSTSRNETLQAQLTHQAWQASLARVSEGVRLAYKEKTEQSLPYLKKIAALKEENRLLRQKVGWDPPSDSSGEEDEGEGERRGR
ncbi:hypothetical protein CAC42_4645 [Sphaceloma murrayae]|uniref:Uncharacterized protein n=1 Tax=Sphaceloma murrayae TaxID=2082308 RepID=A0A2K1QNT7_9PEZI|nr:hypothetical protein CAC42_4645 [Sphaceloma murrayae]